MIHFKGKNILVFGLKRSGRAVIKLFNKHDILVSMADEFIQKDELEEELQDNSYLPYDTVNDDLHTFDFLIKSPGIPDTHPLIQQATELNLLILSEIEVAYQFMPEGKRLIAVTGTNGKTTVTTLLTKILNAQGFRATSCGNIGYPLSEAVLVDLLDVFVCECSSFQLNNIIDFHPEVSLILNLTPNHLDYHGTFESYKDAKFKLFSRMNAENTIIINGDEPMFQELLNHPSTILRFSVEDPSADVYYDDRSGEMIMEGETFLHQKELLLQGIDNMMNVMACVLAARKLGCQLETIREAIKTFEPLKYRIEHIGTWSGVDFYNDSKSTNAMAMLAAIRALDRPLILIAGGMRKHDQYDRVFSNPNIKCVITFGDNRELLKSYCDQANKICFVCLNLLEAMRLVRKVMREGDTVLFSPGAQSFDQYKNYVERGEDFNQLYHSVIMF